MTGRVRRCLLLCALGVLAALARPSVSAAAVFTETFEGGGIGWTVDNVVWQVGSPSGGPASVHGGTRCAATVLNGYYPQGADSRLIGPAIALPASPADGELWLSFWHWSAFNPADSGWVELSVANGPWVRLTQGFGLYSLEWTRRLVNLSAYAGQSVRVAFRLRDNGDCCQQWGWYVDDVEVLEGRASAWSPESFAGGIGRWYAEDGVWQVGRPAGGPGAANSDSLCAGTSLDGYYSQFTDSRLVSPPVTLPASPADGQLWLSFHHWFAFNPADSGWVEISVAGGPWARLTRGFGLYSPQWTRRLVDLSAYAGQSVRVAFRLHDNGDCCQQWGWYVDDVTLIEGAPPAWSPESFAGGLGRWYAEDGTWQVGRPSGGPGAANSDSLCAATSLAGYYAQGADSRLVSPAVSLPASPADGQLWLSFYHWFAFNPADSGWVEISAANGPWQRIAPGFGLYSGAWTRRLVDLSAFAGQSVRVAFHLRDNGDCCQQWGWYVDDVELLQGAPPAWPPEGFEAGIGRWSVEGGAWEVGTPAGGPSSANGGSRCAGTVLDGYYPQSADARLVSPALALPASPTNGQLWLSFYHWFAFNPADSGWVEISVANGAWARLGSGFGMYSLGWTRRLLDLSAYAGQSVRVAFHVRDNGDCCQQFGWYVDDVDVLQGAAPAWTSESFAGGIGRWYAESGTWQVGRPLVGPDAAHGDSLCAGTLLDANYPQAADSRLVSPPLALPASPAGGQLWLSYWQWFAFNPADSGWVEISAANGPWIRLVQGFGAYGGEWTRRLIDLSAYAGQSVRLAFRMKDNGDCCQQAGWYVDDVSLLEGPGAAFVTEDFESGIGRWYAESGSWVIGRPTSGPGSGHWGATCAGTVLGGSYPPFADSRLVSRALMLPAAPADGQLWLSFYHWYAFNPVDSGFVELSAGGGPWLRLAEGWGDFGGDWSRMLVDLSPFAGQSVRLAFHIKDYPDCCQQAGWYVDDIALIEGAFRWVSPVSFDGGPALPLEGGWYADHGSWAIGEPTSGPGAAFDSRYCAGTVLDGYYAPRANTRLIGPRVTLPATPTDGGLWLNFRHWFAFNAMDSGWVEISVAGGAWARVSEPFVSLSGGWTHHRIDLAGYAGQSVRVAFRMKDNGDCCQQQGWYVDNPSITQGHETPNNAEGFEGGTRGWYATRGVWEMGVPHAGPGGAFAGTRCAGTVLDGGYPGGADSRLVTPAFALGASTPQLVFASWHQLNPADSAWVEVSVAGEPWVRLPGSTLTGTAANWTTRTLSLAPYAGQNLRFAFRLKDNGDCCALAGWYVDDVRVASASEGVPAGPGMFEVTYSAGPPVLTWALPVGGYRWSCVYADRNPDFVPDLGNRVALVYGTAFTDTERPGRGYYYYKLTTMDDLWHESMPISPVTVLAADPPARDAPPARTELLPAAPNPFHRSTTLAYAVAREAHIRLDVYSVEGRCVARIVDGVQSAGRYATTLESRGLAPGVYFARFMTDRRVMTRRVVLLP